MAVGAELRQLTIKAHARGPATFYQHIRKDSDGDSGRRRTGACANPRNAPEEALLVNEGRSYSTSSTSALVSLVQGPFHGPTRAWIGCSESGVQSKGTGAEINELERR